MVNVLPTMSCVCLPTETVAATENRSSVTSTEELFGMEKSDCSDLLLTLRLAE